MAEIEYEAFDNTKPIITYKSSKFILTQKYFTTKIKKSRCSN